MTLQNRSTSADVFVRIDQAAATTDAADAAADVLFCNQFRDYTLKTGDKVMIRPRGAVGDAAPGTSVNVTMRV